MDEGRHEPVKATRLLAWLTAGLVVAGAVSAGAVSGNNAAEERRIVTAAGAGVTGVDAPTTTAEVVAPPTTVAPTIASTTTAPAPTTTAATPTTRAPRPTTTTTKAPATTTTKAAGARLTVVNQHPFAVKVTVNGRTFTLAPGERSGPAATTTAAHGNDIVEVTLVQEPSCGLGDADSYFSRPGDYTMTIVASPGLCQPGMPGPVIKVTRS